MTITAKIIPYSSVVGSGVTLHDETGAVLGQLALHGFPPPKPEITPENVRTQVEAYKAMVDRIARALAIGLPATERQVFHPGRGSTYDVVADAALFQVSAPSMGDGKTPFKPRCRVIEDGTPVTVYHNEHGTFVRFPDEMVSPRFEPVP